MLFNVSWSKTYFRFNSASSWDTHKWEYLYKCQIRNITWRDETIAMAFLFIFTCLLLFTLVLIWNCYYYGWCMIIYYEGKFRSRLQSKSSEKWDKNRDSSGCVDRPFDTAEWDAVLRLISFGCWDDGNPPKGCNRSQTSSLDKLLKYLWAASSSFESNRIS